ncbi:MAG: LUD domain-containing protein [Ferruginibacter sp.]
MTVSPAKENILKRIRQALSNPVALPFSQSEGVNSVFQPATDDLGVLFAQEFTQLQGKFAFCTDEADMQEQVKKLIAEKEWTRIFCSEDKWNPVFSNTINLAGCDAAVTGCECLVARTGSMVLSAAQQSGRTVSVYAPVHICIAYTSQLLYDVKDALQFLKDKYAGNIPSMISFATGPSRTADIEKTLVTGVHGPREVYCFLVEA